jgi:acetyl-CoA synthetase
VAEFARSLVSNFGIQKGDPVAIYMPMIVESLIAILACARIGAPHVVVFGGFSAHELGNRIIDCKPKLLICANAGK